MATAKTKKGPSVAAIKKWVKTLKYKKKLGPLSRSSGAVVGDKVLYPAERGITVLDQQSEALKAWKKSPADSLPVLFEGSFGDLAVSADGEKAAVTRYVSDESSYGAIIDLSQGKTIAEWTGDEYFRCCCISADGSYAAFGTHSGAVVTWSAATNQFTVEERHDSVLRCVAISPESNTLVTSCLGNKMIVSSLPDPAKPQVYEVGNFEAAYFLADDLVLIAAKDGAHAVGVWDGITRWSKTIKKGCSNLGEAPHDALWVKERSGPKMHFITREGKPLGSVEFKDQNSNATAEQLLFLDETTAFSCYHEDLVLIKGKALS